MNVYSGMPKQVIFLLALALLAVACKKEKDNPVTPVTPVTPEKPPVKFAIIGDFGINSAAEGQVAQLVAGWEPAFVLTTGDNNYPNGDSTTLDRNVGQYYHRFIYPYLGSYGAGADTNRFFPALGNHDIRTAGAAPHFRYFTLPGNERYYEFRKGEAHIFVLHSNSAEPDGISQTSVQGQWLRDRLQSSTAAWKIVTMHHPPFSSASHGSSFWMQWPYRSWGANAVISGHDHVYERLEVDSMLYITNGLGGANTYSFKTPLPGSVVRYQARHGAMLVSADKKELQLRFINVQGDTIDKVVLRK